MAGSTTKGGSKRGRLGSPKTVLLVAVWCGCLVAAVLLSIQMPGFLAFRGVAQLIEYHPSARQSERVANIPVTVGQRVRAGDVVAQLDTSELAHELDVVVAQLTHAQAELEAMRIQLTRRNIFEQRRFLNSVADAQVNLVQVRTKEETDRAELAGVQARIRWWEPTVAAKAAPGTVLEELRQQAKVLERRLPLDGQAVQSWENTLDISQERLKAFQVAAPDEDEEEAVQMGLEPYRAAIDVLRARQAELQDRLAALTLRSPGEGVVYKILVRPGDVAVPGSAILQIRAPTARLVLAYVSDTVASMVGPGTLATVVPRDAAGKRLRGRVLGLGSGVRALPDQVLSNPNWHEYGEEVAIELDEAGVLAPGQVVDVKFDLGGDSAAALVSQADASPAGSVRDDAPKTDDAPVAADVPAALRNRTRVEPSGLAWVPELDRYLVVSDDTGHPGQNEHAPWLLTMDRQGRFDDGPVEVDGVDSWNDLESITRAPDGTIWVLASQSVSRRGHRPEPRTLLVSLALADGRLRATGSASLSKALAAVGDDGWLASLGLSGRAPGFEKGVAGFDRELNIEGMTWDGDALLLGLKQPVGPDGRAIVWSLSHPERLVATGKLDRADLKVHARVDLRAGPAGHEVAAGISDLRKLPDGRVLLLGVALRPTDGAEPFPGDFSAMFTVAAPAGTGDWTARKVRDFPGVKAEGVAPGPDAGFLMVVFDRDAKTPLWTTMPVPK